MAEQKNCKNRPSRSFDKLTDTIAEEELASQLNETTSTQHNDTLQLAHDLRSPAMVILQSLEMMEEELHGAVGPWQGHIRAATNRMLDILNASLDRKAAPKLVSASSISERIIASARGHVNASGRVFRGSASSSLLGIQMKLREDLCQRVVDNLISNAIRATRTSGVIELRVEMHESVLRIQVTDDGPGFEATQRKPQREGLGIGLEFCRRATTTMHGRLLLERLDARTHASLLLPTLRGPPITNGRKRYQPQRAGLPQSPHTQIEGMNNEVSCF